MSNLSLKLARGCSSFCIAGMLGAGVTLAAAPIELPASAALPLGTSSNRGFVVRTLQAPAEPVLGNNALRAVRQLNGTLVDNTGAPVPNEAVAGPDTGGSYFLDLIAFEKDAAGLDIYDAPDGSVVASIYTELFPGIPGSGGHTDNFVLEAVGFLELAPGTYTFGVAANAERTDVNNDDGFTLSVARNPRDYFGLSLGGFSRNAPGFQNDWRNETTFAVQVPTAGLYPFRIVYWQTGMGASLAFYTIHPDTGERILVNDPGDTRAVKAYRDSTVADANAPYVGEVSPPPGSVGNASSAPIEAVLIDGATTVATSDVALYLNNVLVTPQSMSKTGNCLQLRYDPNASRTEVNNVVRLEYRDSAFVRRANTWSFTIATTGGSTTTVTGQWDFDQGDLRATIGTALQYFDPTFDGPSGNAPDKTRFGSTTELGVPDIGGRPAKVMRVPGTLDRRIGFLMNHGIAPNGGGTRVNQYTLVLDICLATTGSGAASLLQVSTTNSTANDDGDLFWQGGNFGQGTGGYNGRGTFTAGEWHRVVAVYDMAATPPVVAKFVDGIKQDDWTANQSLDAPRRALLAQAVLFSDGDQDERRELWVNSIQIRAGCLSDAEAVLLGGPSADGIPAVLPQTTVTGQWDFEFGDLGATVGTSLAYFDPTFDGPAGTTDDPTQFGTTTDLGVPDIGGVPASVMRVPGTLDRRIGYLMYHRIAPNGGGTRVNQYTLIMDVLISATGSGAASMLQVSTTNNTANDDGDLFWQGNNFGQGTDGYIGTGQFTAGEWHRVVAAYDMAATPPVVVKYVDGIFQHNWTANQGLDNPRRALLPAAVLFSDGDQDERREWWVNSIQIRSGRLSNAAIEALGGPSASGIPIAIDLPEPPALSATRTAGGLTISWPADATGYTLESSPILPATSWSLVPNVTGNSVTVPTTDARQYYRLRQ